VRAPLTMMLSMEMPIQSKNQTGNYTHDGHF